MATAGEVARRAFTRILVESPEDATLDAKDYSDALDTLNDYMAQREANGIRLGYTPVTNVSDQVTIPDGAILGVVTNLAIQLAPEYGGLVSPDLREQARLGLNAMRKLAKRPGSTQYPQTLPWGSGNHNSTYQRRSPYYDLAAQAFITIQGNTVATDTNEVLTYKKVQGHWKLVDHQLLVPDVSGRITNTHTEKIRVSVKAVLTLKATASVTGAVAIYLNGREAKIAATPVLTTTPSDTTLAGSFDMQPNDYIEVWVNDGTGGGAQDVTLVDGRVEVNRSGDIG